MLPRRELVGLGWRVLPHAEHGPVVRRAELRERRPGERGDRARDLVEHERVWAREPSHIWGGGADRYGHGGILRGSGRPPPGGERAAVGAAAATGGLCAGGPGV